MRLTPWTEPALKPPAPMIRRHSLVTMLTVCLLVSGVASAQQAAASHEPRDTLDVAPTSQAHKAPFVPAASEGDDDDPPVDPPVVPDDFVDRLTELLTVVEPGQALDRAGLSSLGDDYDPVTGQVSFTATDIVLPGNNAIPVALRRWVPLDDFEAGGPSNGILDPTGWAWDIPFIRGNYLDARAEVDYPLWDFGFHTWHDGYNCTGGAALAEYGSGGTADEVFYPSTYWQGKLLHIPGVTSETFLTTDAGQQITKSNFRIISCITNPANENEPVDGQSVTHQGIVVAGPNGLTYTFNHIKSYYNDRHTLRSPRVRTRLLMVTRIEDRFGNYVEYLYDSDGDEDGDDDGNDTDDGELIRMEASDGRTIDIDYETVAGTKRPYQASAHGRTWQYDYPGNGVLTVTLPDGTSQWRYEGMDAVRFDPNHINTYQQLYGQPVNQPLRVPGCGPGTSEFLVTVTEPAGLETSYTFKDTVHNRSNVSSLAFDPTPGSDYSTIRLLHCTIHRSLKSRTVSGAGFGPYHWSYQYSDNRGSYDGQNSWLATWMQSTYGDPELPEPAEGAYPAPIETGDPENYRSVTIDGPNRWLVYYIDREFHSPSENTVVATDVLNATGSVLLQRTETTHQPIGASLGSQWYVGLDPVIPVNAVQLTHRMRATQTVVKQYNNPANYDSFDSYTTSTAAGEFDAWGYATAIHESNNFSTATRTTQNTWQHSIQNAGTANEVRLIGLPRTVTINGTQMVEHHYDPTSMLRDWTNAFGQQRQTLTWYGNEMSVASGQRGTIETSTDANNHTTTYSDWKRGTPETIVYPDDTPTNTADNPSRQFFVDDFGQVQSATDEDGDTTSYDYDELGRLEKIIHPDDTGENWNDVSILWQYEGAATEYGVGPGHWRETRTNGSQREITVYDAASNPVLTKKTEKGAGVGTMVWRQFDAAGRKIYASYPLDYQATLPASRPGILTEYDALGRVTDIYTDWEGTGSLNTETQYLAGNKIEVENPRNFKTTTTFQAFGSPAYQAATLVEFADGTTTTILRDVFGKPTSMSQSGTYGSNPQRSVSHSFQYDDYQQLCLQTSPETGRTGYGYHANGLLAWSVQDLPAQDDPCAAGFTPPAASTVYRSYDARDRLTTINYPNGTPDTAFTWYDDGRLDTASRGGSSWDLDYNHRGLLTYETMTVSGAPYSPYVIGYGYNSRGQRNSLDYPSNTQIAFDPDAMGRPRQLGVYADNVDYDAWGAPESFDYGNGMAFAQSRNARGLVATTSYSLGGYALVERALIYDNNGNLTDITGNGIGGPADRIYADGFEGIGGSFARSFGYDVIDRLTSATSSQYGSETFDYDPLGNLRSHTLNGDTTALAYDEVNNTNRIDSVDGADYDHDGRGNVTAVGSFDFTYNLANELVSDGNGTAFAYDARGWRYHQDVTAGDDHNRYYVYDHAGKLIERIDNGEITDFVYLGAMPVARISNGTTTYLHPDYQNTPILETNATGGITRSPLYLAYGFTAQDGSYKGLDRAPGYTGSYPEIETGLNYMGARYQYGTIGRFLAPDPAPLNPLSPVGLNRYAYASDSPARYTDPNGRESVGEMINAGAEGCGPVSCAGWAVLHAAWSMTGAEPISQVADNGWSNVSTGDKIGAVVAVASVVPVARIAGKVAESAKAYSVAFETTISKVGAGTRASHFKQANEALASAMQVDSAFGKTMEGLGVRIGRMDRSPKGWSWHHDAGRPGVMQLVPRSQHQGSALQKLLHPNQVGGFKTWGSEY